MPQFPFEFALDVHTKAGAVKGWRAGNDFAVPELNASAAALLVTNTALGANAMFTDTVHDRFNIGAGGTPTETPAPIAEGIFVTKYRGIVFSDQAGTLYVEESNDGNTWTQTNTTVVSANTPADTGWVYLSKRYYRLRYVNGATAQTQFSLLDSAGAGLADVNATLTGSNVIYLNNDQTTVLAATTGSESFNFYASTGKIAKMTHFGVQIPSVAGATSGTHRLLIGYKDTASGNRMFDITAAYNQSIIIQNGFVASAATTIVPSDSPSQIAIMKGFVFDSVTPIVMTYLNQTNGATSGTRVYRLTRVEEGIV